MRRSSAVLSLNGLLSNTALDPAFGCSEESASLTGPSSSSSWDQTTHGGYAMPRRSRSSDEDVEAVPLRFADLAAVDEDRLRSRAIDRATWERTMVAPPRRMARVELGFAIAAALITPLDPGLAVPAFTVTAIALGMAMGTASCVRNLQRMGAELVPISNERE